MKIIGKHLFNYQDQTECGWLRKRNNLIKDPFKFPPDHTLFDIQVNQSGGWGRILAVVIERMKKRLDWKACPA